MKKNKSKIPLVIIEEVQKVPTILDPIQGLIDKNIAQFVITGSSARKLKQQSDINLLPGRVLYFKMSPFTVVENKETDLNHHLYYGSLPEVVLIKNKSDKEEFLNLIHLDKQLFRRAKLIAETQWF